MRVTLTLLESHESALREIVFGVPGIEGAAFLLCGCSRTAREIRLLVREIVPVAADHYLERRADFLSVAGAAFVHAAKRARAEHSVVVFAHSHPYGPLGFSPQDDREDRKLHEFLARRLPEGPHASLVLTPDGMVGRVGGPGSSPLDRIRIIGKRFRFEDADLPKIDAQFFDRQIRAFGPDLQAMLAALHVGVVGLGGTGSAVTEQLVRLGIGEVSLFDGDRLDASNISRVYGSTRADIGLPKVEIAARQADRIGFETRLHAHPRHITEERAAVALRDCDLIFCCVDRERPRAILTMLALNYLIPVIDLGVVIDSDAGRIRSVAGRATTFLPGEACLFCRDRITPNGIRLESMSANERSRLVKEGYAPELATPAPAVISLTTCVAALAVTELLHRLTGFMGGERTSTEIVARFDHARLGKNHRAASPDCVCGDKGRWGRGDTEPFLGLSWATEKDARS